MDVNRFNFHSLLPSLLAAIADAHFVAFDLELSGISGKRQGVARSHGKATLQQRYEEVKKAAEDYQVLQLGITCVGENNDRGLSWLSRAMGLADLL